MLKFFFIVVENKSFLLFFFYSNQFYLKLFYLWLSDSSVKIFRDFTSLRNIHVRMQCMQTCFICFINTNCHKRNYWLQLLVSNQRSSSQILMFFSNSKTLFTLNRLLLNFFYLLYFYLSSPSFILAGKDHAVSFRFFLH